MKLNTEKVIIIDFFLSVLHYYVDCLSLNPFVIPVCCTNLSLSITVVVHYAEESSLRGNSLPVAQFVFRHKWAVKPPVVNLVAASTAM